MLKYKKIKFILLFLLFFSLSGTNFAYALEINYPSLPGAPNPEAGITDYLRYIFYLSFWIATALAGASFIIGGIRYLSAHLPFFGGGPQSISSAKEQISSAFFGLLILITSILVLNTINPQITVLKSPKTKQVFVEKKERPKLPKIKEVEASMDTLVPFETVAKKIFEYKSETKKPRMQRIKEIARNIFNVSQQLKTKSIELKQLTINNCSCLQTTPINSSQCSSDPCNDVRADIQNLEKNNLSMIGIRKKIDPNGNEINIWPNQPNLIDEEKKAIREIRLLKEELAKLERIENFIKECPIEGLNSQAEFFISLEFYKEHQWLTPKQFLFPEITDYGTHKVTFYCPTEKTLPEWEEYKIFKKEMEGTVSKETGPPPESVPFETERKTPTCEEIPFGKFADRIKRTTQKLTERLESIVKLNRKLSNAVDKLHILISQCSSVNCSPSSSSPPICVGVPCPVDEIESQAQKIEDISKKIEEAVKNPIPKDLKINLSEEKRENIGIIPIIDKFIPSLLNDLEKKVGIKMEKCATDIPLEELTLEEEQPVLNLVNCEEAIGNLVEDSLVDICYSSQNQKPEPFKKCLKICYLEKNYKTYQKCLETCLIKETQGGVIEQSNVKDWFHELDLFCC